MVSIEQFRCSDLMKFNTVNFDPLTETYGVQFYMGYMARWPDLFMKATDANGHIVGYIMAKTEGIGDNWHGHVTALSVEPHHRNSGIASQLMHRLEEISDKKGCYFVDLFVRKSNEKAINFYKSLGYVIYRTVLDYYSGDPDEDAYDMRKALSIDVQKKSVIPLPKPVHVDEIE